MARINGRADNRSLRKTIAVGLAIALIFVIVGAFILSYSLETLDKQAEKLGVEEKPAWNAPFADYNIQGLENAWGTLIAGIVGVLSLFVVTLAVASLLRKKREVS